MGTVTIFGGSGVVGPERITLGPDGNLWFTNHGNDSIGRITRAGVIANFTGPGIHGPAGITAGPDGAVWFTNAGGASIGRLTTSGALTVFGAGAQPTNITTGPDGNLWVTNYTSRAIGRYTPAGAQTMFPIPGSLAPVAIVAGPDGALWFTTFSNQIGRITTAGVISLYTGPGFQFGGSIAVGPDGNAWFTTGGGNAIGRITMAGVISTFTDPGMQHPHSLAAGPDGNLWFTNAMGDSIGRITTGGAVVTFADPSLSGPTSITLGPDGDLWFTNFGSNSIGKISTADVPGAPTDAVAVAGDRAALVSWTAPTATGGATIAGYLVTANPGGRTCTWTSGPTSCVVTGLTNGTSYTFTVTATNGHGTGAASAATPSIAASAFDDVAPASPFFDDIDWLVHHGITTGTAPRQFTPGADVSRQALAAFLYRYHGSPLGAHPTCATPPFTDVPTSAPFCGEVAWLARYGIATGYLDGTFRPTAPVSRQAMAAFLYRVAGRPDGATPTCAAAPFTDVAVTDPFCGEIAWAATHDLALGYPDGTFRRHDDVTRQAFAAFLHRLSLLP